VYLSLTTGNNDGCRYPNVVERARVYEDRTQFSWAPPRAEPVRRTASSAAAAPDTLLGQPVHYPGLTTRNRDPHVTTPIDPHAQIDAVGCV
jgi:hypothetical protein